MGAGLMNKDNKINNANFFAVRGKYLQERIRALGYKVPGPLDDPSLLLPIVYNPKN